jgi:hypothetical protein
MNVLIAQALSVILYLPSAYFYTAKRHALYDAENYLSLTKLEALQVLKFIYKQDCVDFTEDLVAD